MHVLITNTFSATHSISVAVVIKHQHSYSHHEMTGLGTNKSDKSVYYSGLVRRNTGVPVYTNIYS
jgi:hypothetical protein